MKPSQTIITKIRNWRMNNRARILALAILLMSLASFMRLDAEFYRLTLQKGMGAAVDMRFRHKEVQAWFAKKPVYGVMKHAAYPPASHAILWPFLGWTKLKEARLLWAATSVIMLGCLSYLLVRESLAETKLEQLFITLLVLSNYPVSIAIGNGQLVLHILPALITGLILTCRKEKWSGDLLGSGLVVLALVSPSITAPFFWVVLFAPGRMRPAIFVVIGYAALTLFAASFQDGSPVSIIQEWLIRGEKGAAAGSVLGGYSNLHSWLTPFGLGEWNRTASITVLTLLGIWVYSNRRGDLWVLIGVSAIVARVWTYHRWYDDLLILLPMVALFRITKLDSSSDNRSSGVVAGILLAASWVVMLAPARLLVSPPPWNWMALSSQLAVWTLILLFLIFHTRRSRNETTSDQIGMQAV